VKINGGITLKRLLTIFLVTMVIALGFAASHAEVSYAKIRSHSSYHSGSSHSSYYSPSYKSHSYSYSKPKKKGFFGKIGSFFGSIVKGVFIGGIILVILFIIIVIVGFVLLPKFLPHRRRY